MAWSSKATRSRKPNGSCGSSGQMEPWEEPWEEEWQGRPSSPRAQPTGQHDRPVQTAESAMSCSKTPRSWLATGSGSSTPPWWREERKSGSYTPPWREERKSGSYTPPWREPEQPEQGRPRSIRYERPVGSLEWIKNQKRNWEHVHKKQLTKFD